MKTVITTVGTSIFENFLDEDKNKETDLINRLRGDLRRLKEVEYEKYEKEENYAKRAEKVKKVVGEWIIEHPEHSEHSAELRSLEAIHKTYKEELNVILITSDTILSNVAAEIIKNVLKRRESQGITLREIEQIKALQVKDSKKFRTEGVHNLIIFVDKTLQGYYSNNVIFNVTGGYKVITPIMTIMASVFNCDLVYIFEDSEELIKIPPVPISIDYSFIEENLALLDTLSNGVENFNKIKQDDFQRWQELEKKGFIETTDNIAILSPVGEIFLRKYKSEFFVFYASDDIFMRIERNENLRGLIAEKFSVVALRESKTENKNGHLVFDDGDNPYRIFYFVDNDKIFIYEAFDNHDDYMRYLKKHEFDNKLRREVIHKSRIRKVRKED